MEVIFISEISKEKILSMEEQIRFMSLYQNRSSDLQLGHDLIIFTVRGNEIKLTPEMEMEFLPSEDDNSYIEYEYNNNPLLNTVNKIFNNYYVKLYLSETLLKYLETFQNDINMNNTLEGYRIEVTRTEGMIGDHINVVAKKQLI
jgi:hypothetical protein